MKFLIIQFITEKFLGIYKYVTYFDWNRIILWLKNLIDILDELFKL